jgi:hypothetical protein
MAIFYILHTLYPETGESDGKRNSRIFICGILLYIIAYICFRHLNITGVIPELYFGTLQTSFFIMFAADISVMAWIYKNHFGKHILGDVFGSGDGDVTKELPYEGTQQDTTSEKVHNDHKKDVVNKVVNSTNAEMTKQSINEHNETDAKTNDSKKSKKSKKTNESKKSSNSKKSSESKKSKDTKKSSKSKKSSESKKSDSSKKSDK